MAQRPGTLDLIEQITRLDGTKYFEIGNMVHNGRAELAAERGYIKEVRILKLNIPHSQTVIKYENYVNEHFYSQEETMDHWEEWESLRYGSGRDADARGGGGHHLPPLHRAVTRGLFGGAPLPVDFGLLCH